MSRSSRKHLLLATLFTAVIICIGWISQRYSSSVDVTANNRHSLSEQTRQLLTSIDEPVEMIAVLGPDPSQRKGVTALVRRFQTIKPDLSLRFINPETDPAAARELDASPGGEIILRSASREQRLQSLSERSLADSLQQLTRDGARRLVFITGHEERSPLSGLNDDWQVMAQRLASIGLVSDVQSLVSKPHLSDDIDLLIIAAPQRRYFPGELASINNYLNAGGNLLWLAEASDSGSSAPALDIISDNLGIDLLPGTVIDTASQTLAADSPDFVLLDKFPIHAVTRNLTSPVLLPQATALAVTPLAGQSVEPLLQTPESSWTETGPLSGSIAFDDNSEEVAGPLTLGVAIERQLPQGVQRFAVIGDADFAASQFVGNGSNQAFMESLALWLSGDKDELAFVAQRAPDSELNLSNRAIIALTALYLLAIPLILLLMAALIKWRRR